MRRALLAAAGLVAIAYAGMILLAVPPGFPDGYISPYDRATLVWITTATYALLVFSLFALVAAVLRKLGRASVGAALALAMAAALVVVDACPRQDWCIPMLDRLGIPSDDGQGG